MGSSVAVGSAADVIAAEATASPETLVVLGTHGRTGWRAALLGSVTRRVLVLAGGPLLVVPPRERAA
jgi:nucleotide-binding universal stress UspA family protein